MTVLRGQQECSYQCGTRSLLLSEQLLLTCLRKYASGRVVALARSMQSTWSVFGYLSNENSKQILSPRVWHSTSEGMQCCRLCRRKMRRRIEKWQLVKSTSRSPMRLTTTVCMQSCFIQQSACIRISKSGNATVVKLAFSRIIL